MKFVQTIHASVALLIASVLISCNSTSSSDVAPVTEEVSDTQKIERTYSTDALIFNGEGTASIDAEAVEEIVREHGLSFDLVTSSELNAMSIEDLTRYGVIIWPGGNSRTMTDGLTVETRQRVNQAVIEQGVSFAGICAGAFILGNSHPVRSQDYGLGILDQELPYYSLEEDYGELAMIMVEVKFPDGTSRDMLWYGGPSVPEFPGGVIARYPDQTPAIAQARVGLGFVTLSGPHPEAPQAWLDSASGQDRDGRDTDIAWAMIRAALKQEPMAAF